MFNSMDNTLETMDMTPRKDGIIRIPYPIDNSVKKQPFFTTKKIILGALVLLLDFWLLLQITGSINTLPLKIFQIFMMFIWTTLYLRFILMDEMYYRNIKDQLEATQYVLDDSALWGISDVIMSIRQGVEVHTLYYISGMKGVLVKFVRDTMVGAGDDIDFTHRTDLGEALKLVGLRSSMSVTHLDFMDTVGQDNRIELLYHNLKTTNKALKDVVASIYDHIGVSAGEVYHEYDYYLFTSYADDAIFYRDLFEILDAFLMANYVEYELLDRKGIRNVVMNDNGLTSFSIAGACTSLFTTDSNNYNSLRLLWLDKDGVRIEVAKELTKDDLNSKTYKRRSKKTIKPKKQSAKKKAKPLTDQDLEDIVLDNEDDIKLDL